MSALFGFGSGVVGAIAGFAGDSSAAAASARQARESRAWQREENITNREFQERMTRNRYGYQMEDMRSAGLNPMLAFQNSPPGSPPGASGGGGAMGQVNPRMGTDALNSALNTMLNREQVKLNREQTRKTGNEADISGIRAYIAALGLKGIEAGEDFANDIIEKHGHSAKQWLLEDRKIPTNREIFPQGRPGEPKKYPDWMHFQRNPNSARGATGSW